MRRFRAVASICDRDAVFAYSSQPGSSSISAPCISTTARRVAPSSRSASRIDRIANYFGDRAEKAFEDARSLVLLGDFNIVGQDHETMKALLSSGFTVPKPLQALPTNIGRDKYYDQIAFRTRPGDLDYPDTEAEGAGAFDIFASVLTEAASTSTRTPRPPHRTDRHPRTSRSRRSTTWTGGRTSSQTTCRSGFG